MKKFTIFMIVVDILVASCFVLVYGIPSFKNKIISTAMVTKTHKYIAYIFYDEETIDKVTAQNRYIPLTDKVNLDEIVINTSERDSYDNKYDEEILTRDPNNEDYKYIKVKVGKYNAHLVAIYDPSRVKLIASKTFNTGHGQERIKDMCKRSDGIVCINGGRFNDTTGYSDLNGTEGSIVTDELIPQEAENNTVEEHNAIKNGEVLTGKGAQVISTNMRTGELFNFVSEDYLNYERNVIYLIL